MSLDSDSPIALRVYRNQESFRRLEAITAHRSDDEDPTGFLFEVQFEGLKTRCWLDSEAFNAAGESMLQEYMIENHLAMAASNTSPTNKSVCIPLSSTALRELRGNGFCQLCCSPAFGAVDHSYVVDASDTKQHEMLQFMRVHSLIDDISDVDTTSAKNVFYTCANCHQRACGVVLVPMMKVLDWMCSQLDKGLQPSELLEKTRTALERGELSACRGYYHLVAVCDTTNDRIIFDCGLPSTTKIDGTEYKVWDRDECDPENRRMKKLIDLNHDDHNERLWKFQQLDIVFVLAASIFVLDDKKLAELDHRLKGIHKKAAAQVRKLAAMLEMTTVEVDIANESPKTGGGRRGGKRGGDKRDGGAKRGGKRGGGGGGRGGDVGGRGDANNRRAKQRNGSQNHRGRSFQRDDPPEDCVSDEESSTSDFVYGPSFKPIWLVSKMTRLYQARGIDLEETVVAPVAQSPADKKVIESWQKNVPFGLAPPLQPATRG